MQANTKRYALRVTVDEGLTWMYVREIRRTSFSRCYDRAEAFTTHDRLAARQWRAHLELFKSYNGRAPMVEVVEVSR